MQKKTKTVAKPVEKKTTEVKATEVKKEEVKVDVKPAAVKAETTAAPAAKVAEEKKETEVKEAAPKAAAKKAPAKTEKAAAAKEKVVPEVFLQYSEQEASVAGIVEKVKAAYVAEGHRESSIKSVQVYVKPEEFAAYYVINAKVTGRVDLF